MTLSATHTLAAGETQTACLWRRDPAGTWEPVALAGDALRLRRTGPATVVVEPCSLIQPGDGCCWLVRPGTSQRWAILNPCELPIRVNGDEPAAGIRTLAHRDEILLPAGPVYQTVRLYFSHERRATVAPLAEAVPGRCLRCTRPFAVGQLVVRCPRCNTLHHQSEEYPCWTYGPKCAHCDAPTAVAGESWTPEEL